jgi:hypothetical protein
MKFELVAAIVALLPLSGCANGQSILAGFDDHPTNVGLTVVDHRPIKDKESEILSLSISSCDYGIRRLGDETTLPARLVLLRHDLEDSLGSRLENATVDVTRYTMYWNPRIGVLATWTYAPPQMGFAPNQASIIDSLTFGAKCTETEMGEPWIEPTREIVGKAPLIVILEASVAGKTYKIHSTYVPQQDFRITEPSPEIFGALRKANSEFARLISVK